MDSLRELAVSDLGYLVFVQEKCIIHNPVSVQYNNIMWHDEVGL